MGAKSSKRTKDPLDIVWWYTCEQLTRIDMLCSGAVVIEYWTYGGGVWKEYLYALPKKGTKSRSKRNRLHAIKRLNELTGGKLAIDIVKDRQGEWWVEFNYNGGRSKTQFKNHYGGTLLGELLANLVKINCVMRWSRDYPKCDEFVTWYDEGFQLMEEGDKVNENI